MAPQGPVIVIGAHRSGTSALTRVLAELGLFVGARRDPNQEATFFLRLNEWLLACAGARWDQPTAIDTLLAEPSLRAHYTDYLRLTVDSPRAWTFTGMRHALRRHGLTRWPTRWGFKDPRATFTLPLWLDVFPDARIVHIHRHGIDVAASLLHRQTTTLTHSLTAYRRNRPLLRWLAKRTPFGDSARCATRDGAFSLWEEYVTRAHRHVEVLGPRALELSFETLATDPTTTVDRLCRWAELGATATQRQRAAALLDRSRAGAHTHEPAWAAFAERVGARASAMAPLA